MRLKFDCKTWVFLLIFLLAFSAKSQQTNNFVLRSIPAKNSGIKLDGKLDEWDLSGEINICYDIETMQDTHSVLVASMYDKDFFYLSFRFKDRTPMLNHVHPVNKPGSGWRSDAIQMRLWTDHEKPIGPEGARIAHIDCYWFSDEKRPASFVQYCDMSREDGLEGKIPQAIGKGVDAAFRVDKDGKGYTQEMRISWKILRRNGKPYTAGKILRMGLECFWGDATAERFPEHRVADLINKDCPQREFFWCNKKAWGEVKFLPKGNLKPSPTMNLKLKLQELIRLRYSTKGPVAIEYEMPQDGYVTLVIENKDGKRIKNLISDYPRKRGKNIDYWDGTDDAGRLVHPVNMLSGD